MTRYTTAIAAVLFLAFGCSGGDKKTTPPPFQHFEIFFEQDGMPVPVEERRLTLKKKPFVIIVRFLTPDSIFLNASPDRHTQDDLMAGKPGDELPGFRGNGIAEELFNRNEILYLSKNNFCFWYYTSEEEHRFNEIIRQPDMFICKRNIARIADIDNAREPVAVEKIRENTIYLSVMKMDWSDDFSRRIEKKRDYFTIHFETGKP